MKGSGGTEEVDRFWSLRRKRRVGVQAEWRSLRRIGDMSREGKEEFEEKHRVGEEGDWRR